MSQLDAFENLAVGGLLHGKGCGAGGVSEVRGKCLTVALDWMPRLRFVDVFLIQLHAMSEFAYLFSPVIS